jgi:hypothetical protein
MLATSLFLSFFALFDASGLKPSVTPYQLGDEWGKQPLSIERVDHADPVLKRVAQATAFYGGGTAFYLGEFAGTHVMATNHHVIDALGCLQYARFNFLGFRLPCVRVIGDFPDVDLALFEVDPSPSQATALQNVARNFAFTASFKPRQPLLTVGFGVAGNPTMAMTASEDDDCMVFSGENEFKKLSDPDSVHPGRNPVWSFATGCDASHGDSGSPFVDRANGDLLGLLWTGKVPKPASLRDSRALQAVLDQHDPALWADLTYGVPAPKIHDVVSDALPSLDAADQPIVKAFLGL